MQAEPIGSLTGLVDLGLVGTNVSDKSVLWINKLPNLKVLRAFSTQMTGGGLAKLDCLPSLKLLEAFEVIDIAPALTKLGPDVLESLKLNRCHVTDSHLGEIGKLNNLRYLSLNDNPEITDSGISSLTSLRKLDQLEIEVPKLTAACIESLSTMQSLRRLRIIEDGWSTSDVTRLKNALPHCEITAGVER